jgi:tRNA (pseudouridine54-N1)-methyltransferase
LFLLLILQDKFKISSLFGFGMREFIYYSRTAPTSGKHVGEDLMKSGRLDIAIHSLISAFFLSHKIREDVKLHFVFSGAPDPSKHLEFKPETEGKTGVDKIYINKSDVSRIIKKMLYKCKKEGKNEVFPGYWIEKKGFMKVVDELEKEGKEIFILDPKGDDIREVEIPEDCVFVLGDHKGLPPKELKRLKNICTPVSIGKMKYFASQTVAIVNNEIDRRIESRNI